MLIKSITLKNFRQYKGVQTIEFSIDPDKPTTIILGQNTGGKTTLIKAFAWCLYGGKAEDIGFKKNTNLLNEELVERLKSQGRFSQQNENLYVKLEIVMNHDVESAEKPEEKSLTYIVQRVNQYFVQNGNLITRTGSKITKIEGNENPEIITDKQRINKIIRNLLPKELSEYFFYWGERIENLGQKDMNSAITNFLGLDVYTNAIAHLRSVLDSYRRQSITRSSSEDVEKLNLEKTNLLSLKEELKLKLEHNLRDLQYYEAGLSELRDRYYSMKTSEDVGKELEKLKAQKKNFEETISKSEKEFMDEFNDPNPYKFFILSNSKRALSIIEKNKEDAVGWKYVTDDAIDEIIKSGHCICGLDLADHPEARKHLELEKRNALPNSLGGYMSNFERFVSESKATQHRYAQRLISDYSNLRKHIEMNADNEQEIETLLLDANGIEEVKSIKAQMQQYESEIAKLNQKKGSYEQQIRSLEQEIQRKESQIDKELKRELRNKQEIRHRELVERLIQSFRTEKSDKESQMKQELRNLTQKYFDEMYSGRRIIEITSTYKLKVLNQMNSGRHELETSPGLETVKNFSFIAALITLAKKKVKDGVTVAEPYPLVLDAPFSQADEVHVSNICKLIAKVTEQTILVMMEKDWEFARRVLADSVGKEYILNKKTETYTVVSKAGADE